MTSHIAYLSVGSNIGDKPLNCRNGIAALIRSGTSTLIRESGFYLTEPVSYKEQDWFINGVVKIDTKLEPHQLLHQLKGIETDLGRTSGEIRYGPRVLDMDILFYDDLVINTPNLVVPHPRMHKRHFVLRPFCDIDPAFVHPVLKKDVQHLLKGLARDGQRVLPYPCDY